MLAPVPPFAIATTPVNLPAPTLIIFASVIEPSVMVTPATAASTYVLTAFCVGNKTSLVPSVVVADLLAVFSLASSAACVSILIGLFTSEVLSTLLMPKLVLEVAASTYILTAFCVGNKTSLVPSVVVADLFAVFSFKARSD